MTTYEYKVVAAPRRGQKARGVKSTEDRFARALENAINALAGDGWEYLRADTLPCEERQGLTGRTTTYQNLLVFRRARGPAPVRLETPLAEPVADPLPAEPAFRREPVALDRREPPLQRGGDGAREAGETAADADKA